MWIAAGRIVLDFYGNTEAAEKRRQIESLCSDLRKKFNLSALEIADYEHPERCVLGFAAVAPENWSEHRARELMGAIAATIDETAFARIVAEDCELYCHGEEQPMERP